MNRKRPHLILLLAGFCISLFSLTLNGQINMKEKEPVVNKSKEEWKKILTPMEFHILRESGTERPFSGSYDEFFERGKYYCAGCGNYLFDSKTKFNSGCGWPSFSDAANNKNVILKRDNSHGMIRTEVRCARCGGHLGHVFKDGPKPTGLRYCINSASLKFVADKKK